MQANLPMLSASQATAIATADPIDHLEGWQEIPVQAFHCRDDQWVPMAGQARFIESLRERYTDPARVEFNVYEQTGAQYEHVGFGRYSADVKERQRAFFQQHLRPGLPREAT